MKSIFSKLIKSSLFNSALRLAIVLVGLSYSAAAAAGWSGTATMNVALTAESTGKGTVYVGTSNQPTEQKTTATAEVKSSSSATFYLFATPKKGYTFAGWFTDEAGTNKATDINHTGAADQKTLTGSDDSDATKNPSATYYALFKSIISCETSTIDIVKTADTKTVQFEAVLYNAKDFDISVTKNGVESTDLTCTVAAATDVPATGEHTVVFDVTATENANKGDEFVITLTATNDAKHTITVTIYETISLTFKAPSVGGSYSYQRVSDGATDTLTNKSADVNVKLENTDKYTLTANAEAGYRFDKWVFANSNPVYNTNPYLYTTLDGDEITAEFIEDKYAIFAIKGVDGVYYNDLNRAIQATNGAGVVYVYQSGLLKSGNYTIPEGVTLLVPGDSAKTVRTGDVKVSEDFVKNSYRTAIKCKNYLTFEDNTTLTVAKGGAISVYAKMSKDQGWNGTPYTYGRIDMGNNCYITIQSGGVLSALGYILGNPETSSVTAEDGALVYEAFQIADWRGGNATVGMVGVDMNNLGALLSAVVGGVFDSPGNEKDVFPAGQYYVQNIETKLILEYGAIEKLATAVGLGSLGDYHANATFVVPDNATYPEGSGFFKLGQGTKLIKYYDKEKDRQIYIVEGTEGANSTAKVDGIELIFPDVSITVGITVTFDMKISSRTFVLPVNGNMDISIKNATVTALSRLAFMAGSTLSIDKNSEFIITQSQYIYDLNESRFLNSDYADGTITKSGTTYGGYFGTHNWTLKTVSYTPGNNEYVDNTYSSKAAKKRTPENLTDATWVVDGKVTVNAGGIYTTKTGADITSNGNGRVYYGVCGTESETYQALQLGNEIAQYPAIAITNAQLHNDEAKNPNEPYSAGTSAKPGETYTYIESLGKWILPQTLTISGKVGNTFAITLPNDTIQNVVCNVGIPEGKEDEVSIRNFKVSLASNSYFSLEGQANYNAAEQTLSIPVKYTAQNKHNVGNPTVYDYLIVECIDLTSNKTVHGENISLSATEDYTPKFNVLINGIAYVDGSTYPNTIVGTGVDETVSLGVTIAAENNNVAQSLAKFTQTSVSPFAFEYGAKTTTPYADAALKYTPTAAGEHTGTVALTATYTDANDLVIDTTVTITFNAKVNLKNNTLAFAEFPSQIFDNTTAFDLLDASTNNAGSTITISTSENGIVNITGSGSANDPYKVTPEGLGTVTITVTQEDSRIVKGTTISTTITILSSTIHPVPFCVDSKEEFNKHTFGGSFVSYNTTSNTVDFNSTTATSEWIFRFNGTPDELTFTPTGTNPWNVQQRSSETAEWKNIVNWSSLTSGESVTYQLDPTTCQVRIQYGSANAEVGTLQNVCVSELLISANVSKIYMPIYTDKDSEKSFTLTHTKDAQPEINLTTNGLTYTAERSENLGTEGAPYYKTTVTIKVPANTAAGDYTFTATENNTTVSVAISAYTFPQELPIKLATDKPDNGDRYYYVTTASSYAQWDATNRQIVFQNPGSELTRSVTFAFNGAPSIITFDLSDVNGEVIVVDSAWTIKESVDGEYFYPTTLARDSVEDNTLVQELKYTTRYVRVEYDSELTSEVRLSNLVIEGYPSVIVNPKNLHFTSDEKDTNPKKVAVIAINLQKVDFAIDNTSAFQVSLDTTYNTTKWSGSVTADQSTHPTALGSNKVDTIFLNVKWLKKTALDEGELTIRNKTDNSVLAVVPLMGSEGYLTVDKANNSGISTGIPDSYTYHGTKYTNYVHHPVKLTNAFDKDGTAMFDYLFIYGETTPAEGNDITAPKVGSRDGSTNIGSNAVTPLYIYKRTRNADNKYIGYQFVDKVDNVNTADKATVADIIVADTAGVVYIDATKDVRVYMTGFCPYATTGYTKNQEGVFLFRGKHGAKLDIYIEDFHVLSRNKTLNGNKFYSDKEGDKEGGEVFTDGYARGSGGVLVFENVDPQEQLQNYLPFEVSIHTIGENLLSSNYGCFFGLSLVADVVSMKAYQVSSPIHIHMFNKDYVRKTKTKLNFTDEWPTIIDENDVITGTKRTNGFLSLKKQANNAPSIDMGNKHTEVNFLGGRIELQNSQIVSDTYKTTLAISHRSGYFGSEDAGIQLCYGIGTDSVGGTVNFLDGTVTVERMKVKESYRQYYLMDTLADGTESEYTTCLRTPRNTYVRGGSICRVRACRHVTSKGGAPKDKETGAYLGQYVYTLQGKDALDTTTKLATIVEFPDNIEGLRLHHQNNGYTYGLQSVTPDANNHFYFWIPDGYGGVTAEVDKYMSTWKACMTEIGAGIPGVEGRVGGNTPIETDEEVKYLMFCQIDKNIHDVISAGTTVGGQTDYSYQPPFEVPSAAKSFFNNAAYARYDLLTYVSDSLQYQVTSDTAYTITDRVYFVTTATADIWQTFTAPFDVQNIYVVETYDETTLEQRGTRAEILREQASHNADFAAFFAVAMAMGTDKDFEGIYQSYRKWAFTQDTTSHLYNGTLVDYDLRSMQELVPYIGKNWRDANFYLNHNDGNWGLTQHEDSFAVNWSMLTEADTLDGTLLHKGETYSLMFPYCPQCEASLNDREAWDYWSGKFLVFESTEGEQVINGRDFLNDTIDGNVFTEKAGNGEVIVIGNSTFAQLKTERDDVYGYNSYAPFMNNEVFEPLSYAQDPIIYPTTAFLYGNVPTSAQGMPARSIGRTGKINYGKDNTATGNQGGNIPTVGGGNDLFITETAEGVNIAVAEPQHVRVMSATGALLFNGMVQTAVEVALPNTGVYVITGANEVHKILH